MPDFDYGNARLRAMKSRLLPRRTLEALTEAGSVQSLLTALTNTAYREAVQAALVRLTDMECLNEALRNDLVNTLGKVRSFFDEAARELAGLVLLRYDLHNVKTILRGLVAHVPAQEVSANTLPIGELRPPDIAELVRAANWRMAIDLLATWRMPFTRPLLELQAVRRGRNGGVEPFEMEVALDRWYFDVAIEAANDTVLREALALEADAINIMTALRLIGVPGVTTVLQERFGASDVTSLFVGPGHIPFALLAEAAGQESVPKAINTLTSTAYGPLLAGVLNAYAASARLSMFERALARRQLQFAASLFARDPLGIGVLLGYVALKTNEVANLRAIAQGLMLGEKPDRIRLELLSAEF